MRRHISRPWMALCCSSLVLACSTADPAESDDTSTTTGSTVTTSGNDTGQGTSGDNSTDGDGDGDDLPPPPFEEHPASLRRLTRPQFRNAISDLLGAEVDIQKIESDSHAGHFSVVGAAKVVTSDLGVEQYQTAVEGAVDEVFANEARRSALIGCTLSQQDTTCAQDFISSFGRRAFRRPLEAEELEQIMGVVKTATEELNSASEGARWGVVALLLSPHFLYRTELGSGAGSVAVRLTDFEIASRLAFLIWNSVPDEELLDAAEQGALSTSEGVRVQAERLLDDPKGREAMAAFGEEYMRLDRLLTQPKDRELFAEYGPALQNGMVQDMREVWAAVTLEQEASVLELFSTRQVYANKDVAQVYGLDPTGLDSVTFRMMSLPEDSPRIGIMSKLGFLSQFANQKEGSPTLRGKFIREALMCTPVEPPPGGVALELPEAEDGVPTTKRQRLERHREDIVCANCHEYMDPLGLPFESYDAIGRYRTLDNGLDVDPSGDFDGVPVANSRELGLVLSSSDVVAHCITEKFYSYAVGHEERAADEVVIDSLTSSFASSGYRARQLILDIATSEAFANVIPQL